MPDSSSRRNEDGPADLLRSTVAARDLDAERANAVLRLSGGVATGVLDPPTALGEGLLATDDSGRECARKIPPIRRGCENGWPGRPA